jgi:putative hemolysin
MKKLILILFILTFFIVACTQHSIQKGINPAEQSELDTSTSLRLYDLYVEGDGPALVLESPDEIKKVVQALDAQHTVTAKTFCAPRYRLQFQRQDGSTVEIDYFCDDIGPFIRSELGYFENEDYAVNEQFIKVMDELVAENNSQDKGELPNPASVFCEENGGILEIREDENGGQFGVCVFDDGSECDEWKYFRGECEPGEED